MPPLSVSKTGEPTGAVYGFTRMLLKVVQDYKPTHWAISFDRPTPTFRHAIFQEYKAQRPTAPDDLRRQMSRVRDIVAALEIPTFELDGYEADDILGTMACQAEAHDMDVIIVSGDNDLLQLVTPRVKVLLPKRTFAETILYDEATVEERFGVSPRQMPDFKALKGDPSDNIPGVSGIGEKTASKLVKEFGSLEGIYDNLDSVQPEKLRQVLTVQEPVARQGKEMALLVTDAPVDFDPTCCPVRQPDRSRLLELFRELEFFTLANNIPEIGEAPAGPATPVETGFGDEFSTVETPDLSSLVGALARAGAFAIRLVAQPAKLGSAAPLAGMALSIPNGPTFYLPFLGGSLWQPGPGLDPASVMEQLRPLLVDPRCAKLAHNGKQVMNRLAGYGIDLANLAFDTMIAAYLLGEKSLELRNLVPAKLGTELTPAPDKAQTGLENLDGAGGMPPIARSACEEACAIARLCPLLRKELEGQQLWSLFNDVEMPLVPVLSQMERSGMALDTGILRKMSLELGNRLADLESDIHAFAGGPFNINSPQQLGNVLFVRLQIPGGKKTKTGFSTDASILEGLKTDYPIVGLVLQYRQISKLKSTYIEALPGMINPATGRLHTTFNQTVTSTGRLSSSEPNLQNIPIRGDMGREIRQAFITKPPCLLISGDYSQIELRVLAHLSQDPALLEAFRRDEDIHSATASLVCGVDIRDVTPDMRRIAKVVNFGIAYGMSDYGLMQATELSRQDAGNFIAAYFQRYAGVKAYLETTKSRAREEGYVETLLGRRRYIPDIHSSNRQVREAAERMAINMPVQGTAADIVKLAMIRLHAELRKRGMETKLVLQVHDELLLEAPPDEVEAAKDLLREVMSGAMQLSVPLKVDVKSGLNWGDMDKD